MSRGPAKGSGWHMRPTKTLCSLIRVFNRGSIGSQESNISSGGKLRPCSNQAVQMRRLIKIVAVCTFQLVP